jgi:CDGSH-type Zn-finger protein
MPRLVRFHATGPIKIEPQDKPIWVCACGLSKKFPFCDASHKACASESPAKTYVYRADGTVEEIDERPETRG